jgi:hypothetical protein
MALIILDKPVVTVSQPAAKPSAKPAGKSTKKPSASSFILTETAEVTFPVHQPKTIHQPKIISGHQELSEDEVLTNELITLYKEYEAFNGKKIAERIDQLKKHLQSIANENLDPESVAVFSSPLGEVEFSKRANGVAITDAVALLEKLIQQFGMETAISVVKIGMGDLKKLLSEHELAAYTKAEYGSRTLKAVRSA